MAFITIFTIILIGYYVTKLEDRVEELEKKLGITDKPEEGDS